jgi:hypothetical protein
MVIIYVLKVGYFDYESFQQPSQRVLGTVPTSFLPEIGSFSSTSTDYQWRLGDHYTTWKVLDVNKRGTEVCEDTLKHRDLTACINLENFMFRK